MIKVVSFALPEARNLGLFQSRKSGKMISTVFTVFTEGETGERGRGGVYG